VEEVKDLEARVRVPYSATGISGTKKEKKKPSPQFFFLVSLLPAHCSFPGFNRSTSF
jgi:hypothetical protein